MVYMGSIPKVKGLKGAVFVAVDNCADKEFEKEEKEKHKNVIYALL